MPPTKRPQRRPDEAAFRDEEILRADDPRPQRVTQYPVKRSPRKSAEEAIPTGVFDTEKHDEELRASYGTDAELGYKPVFLYVERGPGQGQLVQVRQGQLVIGRASVSELRLQHPSISRRHAMVTRVAEQFYVKDLGSQNGTFVNKQRIATEIEIFPGDTIAMGNAVLKLRGPLQKGEGAPAPVKPAKQAKNKTPHKTAVVQRPKTSSAVKVAIFAGAVGFGLAAVLAIALLKLPSTPSKSGVAAAKKQAAEKADDVVVAIDEAKTRVIDEAIKKKMAERGGPPPAAAPSVDESAVSGRVDAPVPGQAAAAPAPAEKRVASASQASSSAPAPAAASSGGSKRAQILAPYEKGDPDAALDLAKQAGDKDLTDKLSKFIKAYETANEAYVAGQGGPAIKNFEVALKLDEQLSGGWSKKGAEIRKQLSKLYTMVGLIHVKNGSDEDAKTAFAAAVKFDSTNDQAKAQLQILGGSADEDEKPAAAPAKKAAPKSAADDAFGDEEDEKPAPKKAAAPKKTAAPAKSRSQAIDDAFGD